MATVTFTQAQPCAAIYGPTKTVKKTQTIVTSITFSATDVYAFDNLKVPHGAIITNVELKGSVVDGTCIIEIGTYGSNSTADLFGSVTLSATAVMTSVRTTGLPATVSVSDDAAIRYQWMAIRVDGAATSGTASTSINMTVEYYCP